MNTTLTTQDLLNIAQTVGLAATLVFTILQMKKSNKVARSQIINTLYQRLDSINLLAVERPELDKRLQTPFVYATDRNNPVNPYIDMVKTFFYEMYYHHKNGLLNQEEWISWESTVRKFFRYPYVMGYWEQYKTAYGYKFDAFIEGIVSEERRRLEQEVVA